MQMEMHMYPHMHMPMHTCTCAMRAAMIHQRWHEHVHLLPRWLTSCIPMVTGFCSDFQVRYCYLSMVADELYMVGCWCCFLGWHWFSTNSLIHQAIYDCPRATMETSTGPSVRYFVISTTINHDCQRVRYGEKCTFQSMILGINLPWLRLLHMIAVYTHMHIMCSWQWAMHTCSQDDSRAPYLLTASFSSG